MSEHYMILQELGQEDGPYTVEELRELLSTGRLRSHDYLRSHEGRNVISVESVIPDCAQISAARPSANTRIRRKSSDRRPVKSEAPPERVPTVADGGDAPGESPAQTHRELAQSGSPATSVRPVHGSSPLLSVKALGLMAGVVILLGLWLAWPTEKEWLGTADLQGTWVGVVPIAPRAEMAKPMSLTIHDNTLETDQNGKVVTVTFQEFLGSVDGLVLTLTPSHPRFGSKLAFTREGKNLLLMQEEQGIPLVRR